MKEINAGRVPISREPRAPRLRRWGDAEIGLVLRIRRENPTYGKAKIAVILKRDHEFKMSESTVGRILNYLKDKRIGSVSEKLIILVKLYKAITY